VMLIWTSSVPRTQLLQPLRQRWPFKHGLFSMIAARTIAQCG
jgi:hypothetical protein